jgi:hypothetical protein
MLSHKTAELKIFRYVRSAGGGARDVSIGDLTNIVGPIVTSQGPTGFGYVVERLRYLHGHRWIRLDKYLRGYGFVDYDEALSQHGLTENDFFYRYSFRVDITPEGATHFEELIAEEPRENESQIEDPIVFISCGQCERQEIKLGQDLEAAVNDLSDCKGYFAQNQSSLEAVSRHILGALDRAVGFVAVLHPRGDVSTPGTGSAAGATHVRGSVWVEQEIAIAAFLAQVHHRDIPALVYAHETIKREGLREQLKLEPLTFKEEQQVLEDFRDRLRSGRFKLAKTAQKVQ